MAEQGENLKLRDNTYMYFRYYPSEADIVLILIHGIAEDHKYLKPLAAYVANENLAHVYTPDLRGYGDYAETKGDVDYIGQHDDDLMEFMDYIQDKHQHSKVILGGHSAGGGTTLRFTTHAYSQHISGYLLLAPFVHFMAPIMKKGDSENKESPNQAHVGRIMKLMMLNRLHMRKRNHQEVLTVHDPANENPAKLKGLSYRLFMSRLPDSYKRSLKRLTKPALVLIGDQDEEFEHSAYKPLFSKYAQSAKVTVLPHLTHDSLLTSSHTFQAIKEWIRQF
ncbi:Lysophospholipase, alpha-beta hydrolase superfamily [Salinibacillus kushneri]|uniref:Lysophospholipase, alpha-beta hydrolase superfamily n=1 Tax=Salinibacillus kushneri TaxID=237682 RepID=A0A1I0CNQ8_9BACI|nr:alpha/beta fold hydrolase [Salinibacillus kushneri]SET21302.1 Lysophospholipase, alpha-beta hydrolase superfamily [Salinibacillus kushneri]